MCSTTKPHTFVYKTIENLNICLDIYTPNDEAQGPRPVVLFFHEGYLITGSRSSPFCSWFMEGLVSRGFVFVSADYRLLPEVDGFDVLEDAQDAVAWIRTSLNIKLSELGIGSVDPKNLFVAGSSAGGYLAAITAAQVVPRPKAIVTFYGMFDVTSSRYSEPGSLGYIYKLPPVDPESYNNFFKESKPIACSPVDIVDFTKPNRLFSCVTFLEKGTYTKILFGNKTGVNHDNLVPTKIVDGSYPPAFVIHGSADTIVPVSESEVFVASLKNSGTEYEFVVVPGAEHDFDWEETDKFYDGYLLKAIQFIESHAVTESEPAKGCNVNHEDNLSTAKSDDFTKMLMV